VLLLLPPSLTWLFCSLFLEVGGCWGTRMAAAMRVDDGDKSFVFIRHGESINNVLSQRMEFGRFFKEAISDGLSERKNPFRDPNLSVSGKSQALQVSSVLFEGRQRNVDKYHLFDGKGEVTFETVYVSPMRRTLETAMLLFGPAAHEHGVPFKAMPWAHERWKSISDLGSQTPVLLTYAQKFAKEVLGTGKRSTEPLASLMGTLEELPTDWFENSGVPSANLSYYPPGKLESAAFFCRRMQQLEQTLFEAPESAAFVVAHGAVLQALFYRFLGGIKPDNVAMIYGVLGMEGWKTVQPFGTQPQLMGPNLIRSTGIAGLPYERGQEPGVRCGYHFRHDRKIGLVGMELASLKAPLKTYLSTYGGIAKTLTFFDQTDDPTADGGDPAMTLSLIPTMQVWVAGGKDAPADNTIKKLLTSEPAADLSVSQEDMHQTVRGSLRMKKCLQFLFSPDQDITTVALFAPATVNTVDKLLLMRPAGDDKQLLRLRTLAILATCRPSLEEVDFILRW